MDIWLSALIVQIFAWQIKVIVMIDQGEKNSEHALVSSEKIVDLIQSISSPSVRDMAMIRDSRWRRNQDINQVSNRMKRFSRHDHDGKRSVFFSRFGNNQLSKGKGVQLIWSSIQCWPCDNRQQETINTCLAVQFYLNFRFVNNECVHSGWKMSWQICIKCLLERKKMKLISKGSREVERIIVVILYLRMAVPSFFL